MQKTAGRCPPPDGRNDNYFPVVSNLVCLIEHIQASRKILEQAIAREGPLDGLEAYGNLVVLDDVTPCYVEVTATLSACSAGLEAALHRLLDADMSDKARTSGGLAGSDRGAAGLADCA